MNLNPLFPRTETLGINTDLYELTMAAAYFMAGRHEEQATFEIFTRQLPAGRNFLIAAGLEQALHYVLNVHFSQETIAYLQGLSVFQDVDPRFFDYLSQLHFTGHVHALPEGTLFFENEPILQVTAPIIQAQILETYLLNVLNFESMVASKAARLCLAARDKNVVDFGSRRAHSPQAGILAARAAYIGGCGGTSNVLAGFETGIPVYGTMAHSFVQFFEEEWEAFQAFFAAFPKHSILLVDTYDTLAGVRKALRLGPEIVGVRLDSGDLAELARQTRQLLDQHGARSARIVVSGSLDEERIQSFHLQDVPIDAYGVGTELVVSADAPSCDLVYKLVEVIRDGEVLPSIKTSEDKATLPFRKQIFRRQEPEPFQGDLVARWDEDPGPLGGKPLLKQFVAGGRLVETLPPLPEVRNFVQVQLQDLPSRYKHLHTQEPYPVVFSDLLLQVQEELRSRHICEGEVR